jgi:hypothetical protein
MTASQGKPLQFGTRRQSLPRANPARKGSSVVIAVQCITARIVSKPFEDPDYVKQYVKTAVGRELNVNHARFLH